jgi:hypothetical protein
MARGTEWPPSFCTTALRIDESEEAFLFEIIPGFSGKVPSLVHLPVVHHLADLLTRPVQEGLLFL